MGTGEGGSVDLEQPRPIKFRSIWVQRPQWVILARLCDLRYVLKQVT